MANDETIKNKYYDPEKIKHLKRILVGFCPQQKTRTLDEVTSAIIEVGIAEDKTQALNELKYLENNFRGWGTPYHKNFSTGIGLLFAINKRADSNYQVGKIKYVCGTQHFSAISCASGDIDGNEGAVFIE